jgi:glycerol-3-phosphate dehydrogenase (NAD(P)+)
MSKVAVLGAGAWGTALAVQATRAGGQALLWARDPTQAAAIEATRENARHLPGIALPAGLGVTARLEQALDGAALALLAVPAQHLRAVAAVLPGRAPPLLVCAKGVEQGTLKLPLEVLAELRPGMAWRRGCRRLRCWPAPMPRCAPRPTRCWPPPPSASTPARIRWGCRWAARRRT